MNALLAKPIPVLHLKSNLSKLGGVEKIILSILEKSDKSKYDHHICILRDKNIDDNFEYDGSNNNDVLASQVYHVSWNPKRMFWGSVPRLKQIIQQHKIKIIHCHDNRSNFLGLLVSRGMRVKLMTTCYGWIPISLKQKTLVNIDKWILRYFDKVIASSSAIKEAIPKRSRHKADIILNAIDVPTKNVSINDAEIKKKLNISSADNVICTLGRLSPEKGHQYLLEAFSKLLRESENFTLLIVGEGPLKQDLEATAHKIGISEKIIFTGFYPDINEIFAVSDIYIQPSLSESLPVSLLEAMAWGLPVIATDVGGVREVVNNDETGALIKSGSSDELFNAINKILACPDRMNEVAQAGRESIRLKFSDVEMVRKIEDVYRNIMLENH